MWVARLQLRTLRIGPTNMTPALRALLCVLNIFIGRRPDLLSALFLGDFTYSENYAHKTH